MRSARRPIRRSSVMSLEPLEERRVLANVHWDGGAGTMSWNTPANWSNNAVPTAADLVTIESLPGQGPVAVSGAAAHVLRLVASHDLAIAAGSSLRVDQEFYAEAGADLDIGGTFTWHDGEMRAGATTTIQAGGRLVHDGPLNKWIERPLHNFGTVDWLGGSMRLNGAQADFFNHDGADLNIHASGTDLHVGGNGEALVNEGTITVTLAPTARVDVYANLAHTGSLTIEAGQFVLGGGGVGSGDFQVDAGAELRFHQMGSTGYAFQHGTEFSGAGRAVLWHTGHTVSGQINWGETGVFIESGAVALRTVGATTWLGRLTMDGGEIVLDHGVRIEGALVVGNGIVGGVGQVRLHGTLDWYNGVLEGSGTLRVQRGASLNLLGNGIKCLGESREVWNNGVTSWGGGDLWLSSAQSAFKNLAGGRFDADAAGFDISGEGDFINKGFFEVDAGSGQGVQVSAHFSNLTQPGFGGLKVVTGTLALTGEVDQFLASGVLNFGVWSINHGAQIYSPASVAMRWSNASVTLQGSAVFTALHQLERNHGLLTLDRGVAFFEPQNGTPFTNSGTLVKKGSGITTIEVPFRNIGQVRVEGPTGSGASIGEIVVDTPSGLFVNEGDIEIGVRSRLQVQGDFRQTGRGSLSATLGGTEAHQMGVLWVRGSAALGGTLTARFDSTTAPAPGQIYQFLRTNPGGRTGQFASAHLPSPAGGLTTGLQYQAAGAAVRVLAV